MAIARSASQLLAGFLSYQPNPTAVAPKVMTIGYEQHGEPASLVAVLQAARVERLIDVRELPLSRRRGFSKAALADTLADAGIEYEHERALGNPKPYRELYKAGNVVEGRRAYTAHIRNGSASAVDRLSTRLTEQRTCVLCVEKNHRDCHRDVIVKELRRRLPDLVVEHL